MNDSHTKDDEVTLELLGAIEERSDLSQRDLASRLGVALGLTNSYLRRCAKKGYIKVKEVPANRYLYYLTPKGFAEKSRLTAQFLSTSLTFYRQSAESCSAIYRLCDQRGWHRLGLCGASDLAEIALTRSAGHAVKVKALYDPGFPGQRYLSLPVRRDWAKMTSIDVYVVTDLDDPLSMYRTIKAHTDSPDRVLVPSVLGLDAAIQNGY